MIEDQAHVSDNDFPRRSGADNAGDIRVIYDKNDYRGRITIFESGDKLTAWMQISLEQGSGDRFYIDDIMYIIASLGIVSGVKEKEIEAFLENPAPENTVPEKIIIAQGRPPINGVDGLCEILFDRDEPYVEKGQKFFALPTRPTARPAKIFTVKPFPRRPAVSPSSLRATMSLKTNPANLKARFSVAPLLWTTPLPLKKSCMLPYVPMQWRRH